MDKQREAFEAWAKDNWTYINGREDAFRLWQAATAAERERCARIVDVPAGCDPWEVRGGKDGFDLMTVFAEAIKAG